MHIEPLPRDRGTTKKKDRTGESETKIKQTASCTSANQAGPCPSIIQVDLVCRPGTQTY